MTVASLYVDGFNLYDGALKGTPYKWLDLAAPSKVVLPRDTVGRIRYFTAHVSARPHDPHQPVRQQTYLHALQTIPGLSIYRHRAQPGLNHRHRRRPRYGFWVPLCWRSGWR